MSELIPIREAARRLGVSDTAVRKAIDKGRVRVAQHNPENGRPLLAWPDAKAQWEANSDSSKRSHVGSRGSPRREEGAMVQLPTSGTGGVAVAPADVGDQAHGAAKPGGPSYAQSRAIREAYAARLAKLEFEQRSKKLVDADEVKVLWFKHITAAKTRIMGIPASCKSRYADLPLTAIAIIEQVCREALEDLANGGD